MTVTFCLILSGGKTAITHDVRFSVTHTLLVSGRLLCVSDSTGNRYGTLHLPSSVTTLCNGIVIETLTPAWSFEADCSRKHSSCLMNVGQVTDEKRVSNGACCSAGLSVGAI